MQESDSEWSPETVEESDCRQKKNRRLEWISSLIVHPVGHLLGDFLCYWGYSISNSTS